ncbi:hypothetical protein [Stackebrandtia nassauensis]|uniref:Uncharacterized protein n=1 Tax=Stackebrandtia nassauensis (strain DSM 44728 / CIP 108903 / NRRL B-16338 / NBRC 102104 / LLR-40K-21) TaxID=446470 RepID=D3Q5S6_STANL|nr:hypothetical protein [Stackebrandtia nassauensis]ADD40225.1 hypothetical protein Snas_0510 [Stackebrandtia nassauensis DSM 44728]
MNDSGFWADLAENMEPADPWDLTAMSQRVQEAAAEAALAERERFIERLNGGNKSGELLNDATEKLNKDLIDRFSYPADPYDIEQIQQVPSQYEWLHGRDPSSLIHKRQVVNRVAKDLAMTVPGGIGSLQTLLTANDAFTGRVADRFADYLGDMVDVAENQGAMAAELATALGNMFNLLTAAGKDMRSITDETVTALNAIRDDEYGSSGLMGFAVAGALIGLLGSVATGGTTAAIAWSLLSGTVAVAARTTVEASISAGTVEEVLNQMFDAVAERVEEFDHREGQVVKALNADNGLADSHRPELDPDTKPANMYDGRGDLGAADTVLAADLADTHRHATTTVPKLAGQFGSASTALSTVSGTAVEPMGNASQPWETLCTKLQRYSALASNHLYDGGEVLAKAMVSFAEQDGINAKWVREPLTEHEGPDIPEAYTPPDPRPWMDRPKSDRLALVNSARPAAKAQCSRGGTGSECS